MPADESVAHRIVQFLQEHTPQAWEQVGEDARLHLRLALKDALGRLDLVTREDFAVQEKVLARTRQRLEALERQVRELEALANTPPAPRP